MHVQLCSSINVSNIGVLFPVDSPVGARPPNVFDVLLSLKTIYVYHDHIKREHNMTPYYLAVQLHQASSVASRQRLRAASTLEFIVLRTSPSTIGGRAFCMTAARALNTLTPSVQSSESLTIFRRRLKTELFSLLPRVTISVNVQCCVTQFILQHWSH